MPKDVILYEDSTGKKLTLKIRGNEIYTEDHKGHRTYS